MFHKLNNTEVKLIEPEIFNAEYWINGCYHREEVVLYPDMVNVEDSTDVLDQTLCELCIDGQDSVLRMTVGNEVATVWNLPVENGHSRQYDIQEAP